MSSRLSRVPVRGRRRLAATLLLFAALFAQAAEVRYYDVPKGARPHDVAPDPKPGGPVDHGILHLHGRIADRALALAETELILTSADFGDAYLRDGWASQYVEDRMRLNILVLVGYAAEDTLGHFTDAGFDAIGPQVVWARPS